MAKLTELLGKMLEEANASNIPAKRTLGNGLHVSIFAERENYSVTISRDTTYPSGKEWETIFKHFPYYTLIPDAEQRTDADGRLALTGRVAKRHLQQIRLI